MAATIKDVAARAGVAPITVSNVINGRRQRVGEETQQRVLTAIAELHYRPNVAARHLRGAQTGVIAYAIPDFWNPYFAEVGHTLTTAAAARGYTVLLDYTDGKRANEMRVTQGLGPQLIDGAILDPIALKPGDLMQTPHTVPIVLLNGSFPDAPHDAVFIDGAAAGHAATRHLLDRGRRHIAVIGMRGEQSSHYRGFARAHEEAGQRIHRRYMVEAGAWRRADGQAAMRRLLEMEQPLDAVFCLNDTLAIGAMYALRQSGRRIPDDVAVVGNDDTEEGRFASPALTTIAPDKGAMGALALSLLIDRIEGKRSDPPGRFAIPFELRQGGTS